MIVVERKVQGLEVQKSYYIPVLSAAVQLCEPEEVL